MTKGGEGKLWMADGMSRKGVELRGRGVRYGPLRKIGGRCGWWRDGRMAISPLRTNNEGRPGAGLIQAPPKFPFCGRVLGCACARARPPGRRATTHPTTPWL